MYLAAVFDGSSRAILVVRELDDALQVLVQLQAAERARQALAYRTPVAVDALGPLRGG
jgi:hypothetical protein